MRGRVILIVLLFGGLFSVQDVYAQSRRMDFFDKVKLEAGWGLNIPIGPAKGIITSDFIGLDSFYLGSNYALNETWGLRATYAYNHFEHTSDTELQLTVHKLIGEITLSLGNALSDGYYYSDLNDFDLIAHAGIGVSLAPSKIQADDDWMRNLQVGLMPTYRILQKISVPLDISYVLNAAQNYNFGGEYKGEFIGSYFTASLGLAIDLGK